MKNKLVTLSGLVLGFAPVVALAQQATGGVPAKCVPGARVTDITTMLCKLSDLLSSVVPVLIAIGIIYFVWGIISYVIADDEEAKTSGRNRIIAGIIGLAVIISVWGLVKILTNTFGLSNTQQIEFPTVPY